MLDPEHETYVVHVGSVSSDASPSSSPLDVHPSRKPQISDLIVEEAPTNALAEYANFAGVLSLTLRSTNMLSNWSMPTGSSDHPKQVGKGLILPEDLLLADASMVFHIQQCRHTVCIWGTYSAADNQASRTFQYNGDPKDDLRLGLEGQECPRHDLRRVFGLHQYFGINNYPIDLAFIDLAFQVTRRCSHPFRSEVGRIPSTVCLRSQ